MAGICVWEQYDADPNKKLKLADLHVLFCIRLGLIELKVLHESYSQLFKYWCFGLVAGKTQSVSIWRVGNKTQYSTVTKKPSRGTIGPVQRYAL